MANWVERRAENFNEIPENFHSITEEEFSKSKFFVYAPEFVEFKQFKIDGVFTSVRLFFLGNTGWGIVNDYWEGKIKYYAFGCKHKWQELTQEEARKEGREHYGMFCHVNKCVKCGEFWIYDSSG